jgi:hypothetical protein
VANDKQLESDDPMEIIGMRFRDDDGKIADEMARTFVDEYLRMGWPPEDLLQLFRDPFYRAVHAVYHRRGEAYVVELIASVQAAR